MKKIYKILLINIIIFIILLICAELISHHVLLKKYEQDIIAFNNVANNGIQTGLKYNRAFVPDRKMLLSGLRPSHSVKTDKKPIIMFGCSYTYGFGLEENETFAEKLSGYTHRTVINRGKSGTGITYMFYQLSDDKVIKSLPKDAEYVFFNLIPDHFPRLFRYRSWVLSGEQLLRYKIRNNKLEQDKIRFPLLHSLFTAIVVEEYLCNKNSSDMEGMKNLVIKLFSESDKLIKENFKDAKFVILYIKNPFDKYDTYDSLLEDIQKTDSSIKIIDISKELPYLTEDEKYWLEDNSHPSSLLWDEVIPLVQQKLKL